MTTSQDTLYSALLAAQSEFDRVEKDATNPLYKKSYATLGSVIRAVRPALAAHKILVLQTVFTNLQENRPVSVRCGTTLKHIETGETFDTDVVIPLNKGDAQETGSAITYGRRYSLMLACGVVGEEDDDDANSSLTAQRTSAAPAARRNAAPKAPETPPVSLEEALEDMGKAALDLYKTEEAWKAKRAGLVEWVSGGRTTDYAQLKVAEIQQVASALRKKIAEEAANANGK